MIGDLFLHSFRFILLLFVQVLVLNQIVLPAPLSGYLNPFLYVLFLLMLPVNMNKSFLLVVCFLCGLSVDMFSSTAGMHASACLVLGFARPALLNVIAPREGYETTLQLTLKGMGINNFLVYVTVMVLLHHTTLYLIEAFSFVNFGHLLLRIFSSSLATILLIVISQLIMSRSREVKS